MIKNFISGVRSIYWLPIVAVIAFLVSVAFAVTQVWTAAIYYVLVGVFLMLMRIGDK